MAELVQNQVVDEVRGKAITIRGNDIDTDAIIPARFMKCVTFDGLGEYAFYDERYDSDGKPKPHPFNDERFSDASILIVNSNFGCGSSREHAPQALAKWGVRAVVGESFAEIFAGNCTAMGIPTLTMDHDKIETLMKLVEESPTTELNVRVREQIVQVDRRVFEGFIPSASRNSLLGGTWDSTALLLSDRESIRETAKNLPYIHGFSA
ncbi:MAG: 3-isopropylmalate dehydratase small subunit [Spirochaetota bacterium]